MYTILGATGNIGSVITSTLLARGEKVRAVGRDRGRLDKFVRKGAEPVAADIKDAGALTGAFSGARAAFLMLPPNPASPDYRDDQDRESESIVSAVAQSGLHYAVDLSSFGAQAPSGTGPIAGLHAHEQRLNREQALNALHLRAGFFMENFFPLMGMIQTMGVVGGALKPDLKLPMIATRDIGNYAAERLLKLDFSGKRKRELLGERDLSMSEAATIIGRGIGKPDLRYVQFPYDQVEQVLVTMGLSQNFASLVVEMYKAMNDGIVVREEARSPENTTPTSFEKFVQDVFAPAYQGRAATA